MQIFLETRILRQRVDDLEGVPRGHAVDLSPRLEVLSREIAAVAGIARSQSAALDVMRQELAKVDAIVRAEYDDLRSARRELGMLRASDSFQAVWEEREPLVSVVIPTWNRAELLTERAIGSVLRQTYSRLEVVVVGDHCTDNTEDRLRQLGDPRVRFHNLPHRSAYPEDPHQRWLTAGSLGYNLAVQMARGAWIAPLDDDDEFTDDHVEVLLAAALANRYEMVYGKVDRYWADRNEWDEVGAYPPVLGQFALQGALYLKGLAFLGLDPRSWVLDEPNDWNLARRMLEAGVRIGYVDRVVGTLVTTLIRDDDDAKRAALHRRMPRRSTADGIGAHGGDVEDLELVPR